MDYQATLDFLYTQFPMFQRTGQSAYKPGLDNAYALSELMGNPHEGLRAIHVAGTNGKGSTAHTLAAILRCAGYKTGLFTSPHLVDFRERIRIDGAMISECEVVEFVERYMAKGYDGHPSFFELTTIMAFDWFKRSGVDVAVIETGLGGRLDTTNILNPDLAVITNISMDHTALLGDTPQAIASEKAGIIKPATPVVIGEATELTRPVFEAKALSVEAPIYFAEDDKIIISKHITGDGWYYHTHEFGDIIGELAGECQDRNAATVLAAVKQLRSLGYRIGAEHVADGMRRVTSLTGLMGRWMKLGNSPLVICDTGHNVGGWQYIAHQLSQFEGRKHLILGFVNDKDVTGLMEIIRSIEGDVDITFVNASVDRALQAARLTEIAAACGVYGRAADGVVDAYKNALAECGKGDMVFVGGSTFVVADLLAYQALI